jgi:hypothetical protein
MDITKILKKGQTLVALKDDYMEDVFYEESGEKLKFVIKNKKYVVKSVSKNRFTIDSEYGKDHSFGYEFLDSDNSEYYLFMKFLKLRKKKIKKIKNGR